MRLTYVDTAKFLAIYFVIVSHLCMNSGLSNFLFAFHVPLFFILYGFVFQKAKASTVKEYVCGGGKKLVYRVLVPYILISFILGNAFSLKGLVFITYGSIQSINGVTSTHLWFLPCYFLAVWLFNVLKILTSKAKWILPLTVFLMLLFSASFDSSKDCMIPLGAYNIHLTSNGVTTGKNFYMGFPLAFNVAFTAIVFIYLGTYIRSFLMLIEKRRFMQLVVTILSLCLGVIAYFANEGNNHLLAMSYAQYGTYIHFLIGALSLSVFVILVSRLVDNRCFAKYGKYTLPIYAFHLALVFVPDFLFKILHVDMSALPEIKGVVYGTIVLAVSCLLIPLIRKIDSNLIGEHK